MRVEFGNFDVPQESGKRRGRWFRPFQEFVDRSEPMLRYECDTVNEAKFCINSIRLANKRTCPDKHFTLVRRGSAVYVIREGYDYADSED